MPYPLLLRHLVLQRLNDLIQPDLFDTVQNYLEDIACVGQNQLPAHYARYDIDMVNYMTIPQREQMEYDVHIAVTAAIEYVKLYRNDRVKSA